MTEPLDQTDNRQGWHLPSGQTIFHNKEEWFVPENAATEEQLEALQAEIALDLVERLQTLPGAIPDHPGTWYSPNQSNYVIEPAAAPLTVDISEENIPTTIEPTYVTEPGPFLPLDEEGDRFRAAPYVDPPIPEGYFAPPPELPMSILLEGGLGGLRDAPISVESHPIDVSGISLEEAAQARDAQSSVFVEVPQRGLGGIRDVQYDSVAKLDTNELVPTTGETRALSNTEELSPHLSSNAASVPTPEPQQTPAEVMQPSLQAIQQPQRPPMSATAKRFREVEQAVAILRQQFAQGQITRSQLENELRRLLVLDDQGRWWTLGVDSSRWYRYDGREWVPDTPPESGPQPAMMAVPTETGVFSSSPTPVTNIQSSGDLGSIPKIALDEYGMPLPQKVPQDDPGATMVNITAFTSRVDEKTLEQSGLTSASRPYSSEDQHTVSVDDAAQAVSSMTQESAYDYGVGEDGELIQAQGVAPAKKIGDSIQPDYSEALGSSRGSLTRLALWAGVVGVVTMLGMTLCVLLAMVGYYFSVVGGYQEEINNLPERASTFQTTEIYASDGTTLLATFNDPNRGARRKVTLDEISPWAIHALVSTEDETYYENPGFSVFAIMRATYTNLTGSGARSGASTITQQLARRLLLNEEFAAEVSAGRKVTEIILAAEISRKYSKNEILELYFNEVSFGGFTVGIEAAAQTYFGKPARDLNIFEAALLVGQAQSPGVYDPFRNREAALGRMETVLRLMLEANDTGCIQMEHTFNGDYETLVGRVPFDLSQPLCVTEAYLVNDVPHLKAQVQIRDFTPPDTQILYAHFSYWVWGELLRQYGEEYIFNTGFRVITTINPAIQNEAQQAIRDQIAAAPGLGVRVNNGSVVAMDTNTGAVLAMVGSANFRDQAIDGEVNVAFTPQQPGSSIKPVVYLTALEGFEENGQFYYMTPASIIWDTETLWGNYRPTNFDNEFRGPISVRNALANSLNVPAVKALDFVTPYRFEQVANRMRITFPLQSPVAAGLPSALGAAEVYLFDMVAGYSAFANGGIYNQPFGVYQIQNINTGEIIYDWAVNGTGESIRTIDPIHAYMVANIMSDVNARRAEFGAINTTRLELPNNRPAGVKTGTTNDNRDALTIGYTPQVIVGVWMGNTDNTEMGRAGTGFNLASPVWNRTIQAAINTLNLPIAQFPEPLGITRQVVCRDSGTLPPQNNPALCGFGGSVEEIFSAGDAETLPQPPPSSDQGIIEVVQVDQFTNLIANEFCPNYVEERTFLQVEDPTALVWLQTAAGATWASQREIDLNSIDGTLPTGECTADYQTPVANLLFANPTLTGLVTFAGQANVPNFQRYEIQYATLDAPNNFATVPGQVYPFAQAQPNSVLGTWVSTGLPDGSYFMRVEVFSNTGASITSQPVQVVVGNGTSLPTQPQTDTTDQTG